jgi:2-oxoglutarate dehydrogenase E1 component
MYYYELLAERSKKALDKTVAIVRIEQLYPPALTQLDHILSRYSNARQLVWAQEEPQNMGAWSYMMEQLLPLLRNGRKLYYAGRERAASPATGSFLVHNQEQAAILGRAFQQLDPVVGC